MESVRLGIIGAGDMGGYHTLSFAALPQARVVAVADINAARLEELLAEIPDYPIQRYSDYKEMLRRDDLEAVIVAVPQYLHREATLAALEAGLDVYLEKPIARSVAEADEIIEAHRATDRILQIGLEYRYAGLYRKMAELCRGGDYGQTTLMWCKELRQCFPPRPWFYDQKLSGGALMDKNVHHFDVFNWMIGTSPERVFALGGQHVILYGQPYLADCTYSFWEPAEISTSTINDHAWVLVEYANGARACLGLCMYLRPPYPGVEVGAITHRGYQLVAQDDARLTLWGGPTAEDGTAIPFEEMEAPWVGHVGAQQARLEFLECVRTRRPPACDPQIGRDAMAVCQAAELSIAEGRMVYIDEVA